MDPTMQTVGSADEEGFALASTLNIAARTSADSEVNEPRKWVKPYYAAFDGLRALAVIATFLAHYVSVARLGAPVPFLWTGVDVFFVLSGFLITGILCESLSQASYFRHFYTRRSLRILPLSYGFFLLVLLLTPILHLQYNRYVWTIPLYVANFFIKGATLGQHGPPLVITLQSVPGRPLDLGPLWSLCVEEQFYLVWPLLV